MTNNYNLSNNNSPNNYLNLTESIGFNIQYSTILNSYNEKKLFENCANLCKDQAKCRILEQKLEENPILAPNYIYNKIKDKFYEISLDQFGNYFMQKVLQYLNIEQINELLLKKLPTHFRCLCFNQYGTRVIQKLFERIVNIEECLDFYSKLLNSNLNDFIKDQNANHIIIKYINIAPSQKINFIIEFIIKNIYDLSTKKHSCCVIQKCIEYSQDEQKKELLRSIADISYELINDQYGNYVVQYCINVCDYEINKIIAQNFLKNLEKFSVQKYSSNVIEKCLDCCDEETKEIIVQQFCNPILIRKLLFDVYGNYVIQKVMMLSKEPIRSQYIQIVGPLMNNLLLYPFGQKLYNKLLTYFRELSKYVNGYIGDENKFTKRKNKKSFRNFNSNFYHHNNVNNINNNININFDNYSLNQMNYIPNINNNLNIFNNYSQNCSNQNGNNQFDLKNINMNNINILNLIPNNQNNNILYYQNLLNNNIYNQYQNNNAFNLNKGYIIDNLYNNNKVNMDIN